MNELMRALLRLSTGPLFDPNDAGGSSTATAESEAGANTEGQTTETETETETEAVEEFDVKTIVPMIPIGADEETAQELAAIRQEFAAVNRELQQTRKEIAESKSRPKEDDDEELSPEQKALKESEKRQQARLASLESSINKIGETVESLAQDVTAGKRAARRQEAAVAVQEWAKTNIIDRHPVLKGNDAWRKAFERDLGGYLRSRAFDGSPASIREANRLTAEWLEQNREVMAQANMKKKEPPALKKLTKEEERAAALERDKKAKGSVIGSGSSVSTETKPKIKDNPMAGDILAIYNEELG